MKLHNLFFLSLCLLLGCSCRPSPSFFSTGGDGGLEVAVFEPGAAKDPQLLDALATRLDGYRFPCVAYYANWDGFDTMPASNLLAKKVRPWLVWEPTKQGVAITFAEIAAGSYDTYLHECSKKVAALAGNIRISFAPEANGEWAPWYLGKAGNDPDKFVAAWKHVHDIFSQEGATNVEWIWVANIRYGGDRYTYASFYPGDDFVDYAGLDGYNWGDNNPNIGWRDFSSIYGRSIEEISATSKKPLAIGEIASSEKGGDKAEWIRSMLASVKANSRIKLLCWFNENKEAQWAIDSSLASKAAFLSAVK